MLRLEVRLVVILATIVLLLLLLAMERGMDGGTHSAIGSNEEAVQSVTTGIRPSRTPNKKRQRNYIFDPLPSHVVDAVDGFVFFVGYARSGHSIIASFLDAHPNIVIAHEYALLNRWAHSPELFKGHKDFLFNTLYNSSRYSAQAGLRQGAGGLRKKGYTLEVPGWYQGTYEGGITIIGDKAGGMTAQVYRQNKKRFVKVYQQLCSTSKVPVYAIHVVRNPYDNIATMLLYNEHVKQRVNLTNKYHNYKGLQRQIKTYFVQVESVLSMIEAGVLNDITIHHSSFISNPKAVMRRVCKSLSVTCSERYLQMVADRTFTTESHSRHLVEWAPELKNLVQENISKYPLLKGYKFD